MKRFKKVLSIFLTGLLVFNLMTITAFADDESDSFDVYLKGVAERFFNIIGFENGKEYQISNSFDVYNFDDEKYIENRKLTFIISDNKIIGLINSNDENGEYISNYQEISSADLNCALNDSSDIVMGCKGDTFYILSNNNNIYMSNDLNKQTAFSDFDFSNCSFDKLVIDRENVYNPIQTRSVLYNKQLNVKRVENSNSPRTGKGLCWAACVAMKVNYQYNKSYTAMNVYNAMYNKYHTEPLGQMIWYNRAYLNYGMTDATYYERGLGSGTVSNAIRDNRPVNIDIWDSTGKAGHAVIISGVTICDNYSTYTLVDPNEPVKIYQDISLKAMSDPKYFVYYAKEYTYTNWTASVV